MDPGRNILNSQNSFDDGNTRSRSMSDPIVTRERSGSDPIGFTRPRNLTNVSDPILTGGSIGSNSQPPPLQLHKLAPKNTREDIKKFERGITQRYDANRKLTKDEKSANTRLKVTAVASGILIGVGAFILFAGITACFAFCPPAGVVIGVGAVVGIVSIPMLVTGGYKGAGALFELNQFKPNEREKLKQTGELLQKCQDHFIADDGFAEFLQGYQHPLNLDHVKTYLDAFEGHQKSQERREEVEYLKARGDYLRLDKDNIQLKETYQDSQLKETYQNSLELILEEKDEVEAFQAHLKSDLKNVNDDISAHEMKDLYSSPDASPEELKEWENKRDELYNRRDRIREGIAEAGLEIKSREGQAAALTEIITYLNEKSLFDPDDLVDHTDLDDLVDHTDLNEKSLFDPDGLIKHTDELFKTNSGELKAAQDALEIAEAEFRQADETLKNLPPPPPPPSPSSSGQATPTPKPQKTIQPDHVNLTDWLNYVTPGPAIDEAVDLSKGKGQDIFAFGERGPLRDAAMVDHGRTAEYNFLSNSYPGEITVDGRTYPSVDHYMLFQLAKSYNPKFNSKGEYKTQESKSRGQHKVFWLEIKDKSPEQARAHAIKQFGGDLPFHGGPAQKERFIKKALFAKFVGADGHSPTPEGLRLMQLEGKRLIAGSLTPNPSKWENQDRRDYGEGDVWGAVFSPDLSSIKGENKLGNILMELRDWLIEQKKNPPPSSPFIPPNQGTPSTSQPPSGPSTSQPPPPQPTTDPDYDPKDPRGKGKQKI